jgi:hypothetical protein
MQTIHASKRLAAISNPTSNAHSKVVTSSLNPRGLEEIVNPEIQRIVKKFAAIFQVKRLGTDGYNQGGSSGCEILFEGPSANPLGDEYGAMDYDELMKLMKFINSSSGGGLEFTLLASEKDFALVIQKY